MPANSNLGAPWYPVDDPAVKQSTRDWMRITTDNLWSLRNQHQNLSQTVQNFASNTTQNITEIVNQISNNNANPPAIFGTHALRLASTYTAGLWLGYLFIETDRFQAAYYSNGNTWVLIEGEGVGTFESRWSGLNSQDAGLSWIETSRNNLSGLPPYPTYRWTGSNWNLLSGMWYRNQNQLAVLAATFGANNSNDIGGLASVTDFRHQLQWGGNNWGWGPQDDLRSGEGPILREVDPFPLTGWQLYDGSTNVPYMQSNGNVALVSLPNLSSGNAAFLEAGGVNGGVNPAVAPTLAMNAYTPTGNVSGNLNVTPATVVGSVSGNNVSFTPATVVGNVSLGAFAFAGDSATLTGSISNNGQPPSLVRRAWFRK